MIAVLAVAGALFLATPAAAASPTPGNEASPAAASPTAASSTPTPGRTGNGTVRIFGGSYTLAAGEVVDDVQVTGGSVRIEGTVTGDVTVVGGSLTIDGTVGHDVRVTGGSVRLGPTGNVGHDVSVFGGSIHRAPGSQIGGSVNENTGDGAPWSWWPVGAAPPGFHSGFPFGGGPFDFIPGLGLAVAIVVIGILLQAFFPRQLASTGAVVAERPLISLGVGCLTAMLGALVAALLAVTILLIPGSVAVVLGMIAAFLFGWTAIVLVVGQRVMQALDWQGGAIPALVVGGVLAALVLNVPFLGGLVLLLGGAVALGAVVLTRFGTQPVFPWLPPGRQSPPPP